MEARKLEPEDYDMLVDWWKAWRWTPPTRDMLPENGECGVMITDGATPVCAGFLYETNSKIAWIEFIISNLEYKDKAKRAEAIGVLIDVLTVVAKAGGFKLCYSISMNSPLTNAFIKSGYLPGAKNFTELIKHI
jgi:hypothetical protein